QIQVFDANHNPLAARVLTADTGVRVIQVDNVPPNADYYVRVTSAQSGAYSMSVDFTTQTQPQTLTVTGTLGANEVQTSALVIGQSQQVHLVLATTGSDQDTVVMTIRDRNGQVVYRLLVPGGIDRSADVFLQRGTYQVEVSAVGSGPDDDSLVG